MSVDLVGSGMVDGTTDLGEDKETSNKCMYEAIVSGDEGMLMEAVRTNNLDLLNMLASDPALTFDSEMVNQYDEQGWTCLHYASLNGCSAWVEFLLVHVRGWKVGLW